MDKEASAEALGWTLCAVLGLSYGLVAGVAGCRALNLRGRGHGGPWTTQKVLHLLVTLCAAARCAFFAHASTLWDWEAGTVSAFATPAPRLAFYVLDQLPTTVLFTIYASVALFWAEMVFVATDGALLYEDYARPADAVVNAATYALLVMQWAALANRSYAFYAPGPYALVSAALYAFAAALLVGFGRAAAYELRRVPIEGVLRRKKLREIGALTSAGAFATLGRSVALLAVRDRALPLEGPWDALVAAGYFGLLELAPVLLVLYYYRRIPRPRRPDEHAALFPLKGAGRDARDALRRLAELQFEPFEPAESVL